MALNGCFANGIWYELFAHVVKNGLGALQIAIPEKNEVTPCNQRIKIIRHYTHSTKTNTQNRDNEAFFCLIVHTLTSESP